MAQIVKIDNKIRDSIEEALDKDCGSKKVRPYYYGVQYKNKFFLIPLRSNCPRSYSLKIQSIKSKPNAGLDFCKMIILDEDEVLKYTSIYIIDDSVFESIKRKESSIKNMIRKTLISYKKMLNKKKSFVDLTKEESFLNKRSTLKNYLYLFRDNDFLGL